jgi:hypothetical protein
MRKIRLINGLVVGLRLGGLEDGAGGWLEDGTPIAVMGDVDNEGYKVEFVGQGGPVDEGGKYRMHPWEESGRCYFSSVWRRVGKADVAKLSKQQQEFVGLDPEVQVPTGSYHVFGSGSGSVYVSGKLPDKPEEDFGHNGFCGMRGIVCRLSEVPAETEVKVVSYPGGTKTVIRAVA